MTVYLVQHGTSVPKAQDPLKGLSAQGIVDVQRIAKVAADYGVKPARIIHSGKRRALQTADIMAAALHPENGVHAAKGLNPLDDVIAYARSMDFSGNIMIVGHLPFLEKLAAYLVTGQHQTPIFQFQNGGVVCLEYYRDTLQVVVKWALMPNIQ